MNGKCFASKERFYGIAKGPWAGKPRALTTILLNPVLIEFRIKADDEVIADPVGGGAQVAAWPHRPFEDRLFFSGDLVELLELFTLGDGDAAGILQQAPGRRFVEAFLARINDFLRFNLFIPKKLLGIGAGRSALAQIGPIDLHPLLLLQVGLW